jgi:hypothetical protein
MLCLLIIMLSLNVWAQKTSEELAQGLQNPLANFIRLPVELNMEYGIGTKSQEGSQSITNIQPVIPVNLTNDWLVINRIITPIISQTNIPEVSGTQNGIGDILYSAFLSPAQSAITWGLGPALSIPTGTDNFLSKRKWSLGPTFVALKQTGPWTVGALSYQLWSIAGDKQREEISEFYFQPFIAHTMPSSLTFSASMQNTYDWKNDQWVWSFIPTISKVFRLGNTPLDLSLGPKFFAGDETIRPNIGFEATVTFMFEE